MNYEFYEHKRRDKVKWVIVFISIILLGALVLAAITNGFTDADPYGWLSADEEQNSQELTNDMVATEGDSKPIVAVFDNELMTLTVSEPASSTIPYASNGVQVNATVFPQKADQRLVWSMDFENPEDTWADGKEAKDYVSIEYANAERTVVYVNALQPFASVIKLTATCFTNPEVSAYLTVDYSMKLKPLQNLRSAGDVFFSMNNRNDAVNYVKGIINGSATEMSSRYFRKLNLTPNYTEYTLSSENVTYEYSLIVRDEFKAALTANKLTPENSDYIYLGTDSNNVTAGHIINAIVGAGCTIIPDAGGTVNLSLINRFNAAAMAIGEKVAFDVVVTIITDFEATQLTYSFAFDTATLVMFPTSIVLDETNIVL